MSQVDPSSTLAAWIHPLSARATDPQQLTRDAAELVVAAREHRVAGLLARALQSAGALSRLAAALPALRRAVMDEQVMALRHADLGRHAAAVLERSGIGALLLKGAALGPLCYPDPTLRPMTDIDLLVLPADREQALRQLQSAGFVAPSEALQTYWKEAYYNLPLEHPDFPGLKLELHWSIAQRGRHAPDLPGLMERSQALPGGGRGLGNEDLLLHLSLHHGYHYFEPRLIWLHDLALLHARPHELATLWTRAAAWRMQTTLRLSAHFVEQVFPGSVPAGSRQQAAHWRRRAICALFPPRRPGELIGGWDRRSRQLLLGALMIDRPSAAVRQACGWCSRALRFGDRAGRKLQAEQRPR